MAKVVQLRPAIVRGREPRGLSVSLAGEDAVWQNVDLNGLLDSTVIPMMVDAWLEQNDAKQGNNDNGEQP